MSIQAFFWDYDNTIFETAAAHWSKHQVVLARHGIELSESYRQKIYENNGNQNWEWMHTELGLKVPQQEYLQEIDAEFQKSMLNLEMRPGVAQLFNEIAALEIPQAIITNARRHSAEPVLRARNVLPLMKFILFKEDYEGRKPDPEPYLAGLQKMRGLIEGPLDPKRCVAIEDDPLGVESAHKAGLLVIHRKLSPNDVDSPYADFCCFHEEDFIKIVRSLLR